MYIHTCSESDIAHHRQDVSQAKGEINRRHISLKSFSLGIFTNDSFSSHSVRRQVMAKDVATDEQVVVRCQTVNLGLGSIKVKNEAYRAELMCCLLWLKYPSTTTKIEKFLIHLNSEVNRAHNHTHTQFWGQSSSKTLVWETYSNRKSDSNEG